jgi:hypothetical protein
LLDKLNVNEVFVLHRKLFSFIKGKPFVAFSPNLGF